MAPPQWAYQVENFINEPDEELVCSVCRAVFCDPVMCPCDHVFCRACITKWIQSTRNCPICRKRVSHSSVKQTVPIVKNIIMKLMLNCHNKSLGCTAQFSLESSETHVKECEYELVQCKNKPCKDRLFRKDITEHETSDCPHRYIKCKICGLKMPTSALPEKHDCVRALQFRLRKKSNMIRKKNERIKQLRNEIKALKTASQGSERSLSDASQNFAHMSSSLSPEDIMINIAEFDSTSSSLSFSSDSENSSDESIIIFTNSSPMRSRNAESDSFFTFMDEEDGVEYSRSESPSPRDFNEYRNAESQTMDDLPLSDPSEGLVLNRNDSTAVGVGPSRPLFSVTIPGYEGSSQLRRQVKRRPSTQKPAKRRFPHSASSDVGEPVDNLSAQASEPSSFRPLVESDHTRNNVLMDDGNARSDSNPVAVAGPSVEAAWNFNDVKLRSFPPAKQKHTSNAVENIDSTTVAPSRNAVFERTLALLEQYSLDSDPEWLPEYASHRGDTTSESDTSNEEAEFISESSTSELSDGDEGNSVGNRSASISDIVHCSFDNTSDEEEDPDWNPMICMNTRTKFAPK